MATDRRTGGARWTNARANALLLLFAIIPIVGLGGTFGYYLTASQRQTLDQGIDDRTKRLALALSKDLSAQVQLLAILSESPRLDPPLQGDAFAVIAERLRQKVPSWTMVRITGTDGAVIVTVPDAHPAARGKPVVETRSHDQMIRSGKPVVGDVTIGPRGLPGIPIRVPVIRGDKVVYGLTSVIRPSALTRSIVKDGLPAGWASWITDSRGVLVSSTFSSDSDLAGPASRSVAVTTEADGVSVATLANRQTLRFASAPVDGTNWTIAVGMPSDAYVNSYQSGLTLLTLTTVLTLLLSGLAALLFLREINARRREEAQRAARANQERLVFLDALNQAVSRSRDADEIMAITTRMVGETMRITNCAYADMDEDEDGFTIRGDWAAEGSPHITGHYSLRDFGALAVERLSAGQPLVISDNARELAPEEAATFQAIGIAATICMPLVKDGRLTALMAIHDRVPHAWDTEELAIIREVTERSWAHIERVRAEAELLASREELRRTNENLEAAVAERTGELMAAEESLRQAQKMEAVGQLTGGLAHDFNNILAGILGSLELTRSRIAQGRVAEVDRYLSGATTAARRGAALTQRMLAFSRRQTLDPKPTDMNQLVRGIEDFITRSVGPGIRIDTVPAEDLWPVFVDAGQLENALLNLCINSRDAMPDGGTLTIETANRWIDHRAGLPRGLPPGHYASLSVSDTGTGMPPDVIARAFDPFFTTKPTGQGTGLGLSMVWGFAGQSGGSARIYSVMGEGTTVRLYLPRHQGEVAPEDDVRQTETARSQHHQTILLVDDEPLIRTITAEQLAELGYRVLEAGDAGEALRIFETERRIALLISDVGLPDGMNGRQLADAVRTRRPRLPVLFITGYAEHAVLNEGNLEQGMQVIPKPFDIETLTLRMEQLLKQQGE